MSATITTNMGLSEPALDDAADITVLNTNTGIVDVHDHANGKGVPVKRLQSGALASRPAAGNAGHHYLATDTNQLFEDNGVTWQEFARAGSAGGTTTLAPLTGTLDVTGATAVHGVPQQNLLVNPGFELWQRGNGAFTGSAYSADRWLTGLGAASTLSISKDAVNIDVGSAAAAACTYVHGAESFVSQKIEDFSQLRGKTITLSVRGRTATASALRAFVQYNNGANVNTFGAYHSGGGTYETLTASVAVPANATTVVVGVAFDASCTAYLDNSTLVVGSVAMDYLPLTPADDLARCLRYYQRWTTAAGAVYIPATGAGTSTTSALYLLPLQTPMGAQPTLSLSAVANWNAVNSSFSAGFAFTALTILNGTNVGVLLNGTIASASLSAGQPAFIQSNTAGAWLALEWNP